MSIQLTAHQEQAKCVALARIIDLHKDCRIGGFAGTGKTTLISSLVDSIQQQQLKVLVMAPTGKAANVLCNKGVAAATIHRTLYEALETVPVSFRLKESIDADFFIIDESSMISTDLLADIQSFGKPTVFIGDPAQLEPVGDDAKLMHKPDFVLTEIHRTAAESPILAFASQLRKSPIHPFAYFNTYKPTDDRLTYRSIKDIKRSEWMAFDQIIVGKNLTRHKFNQTFRKNPEKVGPSAGDKVICLRNSYPYGVFNGETFTVISDEFREDEHTRELTFKVRDVNGDEFWVPFWFEYFQDVTLNHWAMPKTVVHFDFAYAITCHKSQGSEWDNVAVLDEAFGNPPNRWRYTAATRAAKQLTWVRP